MKVGIFCLLLLYVQNSLSNDRPYLSKGISHGKSGKKDLQILISRKFLKTKKPLKVYDGYTAFPAMGKVGKLAYNVPDSPVFPASVQEQKTRVKKILPDYSIGAARKKRSAATKKQEHKVPAKVRRSKVAGAPKRKSAAHKNNQKKAKRSQSKTKRSRQLGRRKHVLRTSNANATKNKKPLRHTNRASHQSKGNKTTAVKPVKRAGNSHKATKKAKGVTKKAKASRRLIAAKDAAIEDYPYVVSIQKGNEHWCAGALLNPRLVITTANCVWKASRVSRLRIRAGSRYTDEGGQMAKIQEMRKHPHWSIRRNPDHDVALLLLDRNLKFSHSLHAVDLPNRVMLPAFQDAWVTSWGAERRDGVYDKTSVPLQSVHTRLMDRGKCNNVTQRFGVYVTENFICLSQLGKRAPCTRDTGAPAVSDGVVWGLASWGIRKLCGTQRFPAMFSYLASQTNMDFIINATHELMGDERHYPFPDGKPHFKAATREIPGRLGT